MFMEHTDRMQTCWSGILTLLGGALTVCLLYSRGCPGVPGLMVLSFGSLELIWTPHSIVVLLHRSSTYWTPMT